MIQIRMADMERDAPALMDAMRDFSTRIAFADLCATGDELTEAVADVMTADNVEVIVADRDGEIVGCLGIVYGRFLWNRDVELAEELFWWAKPGAPFGMSHRLYFRARSLISERGAVPTFRKLETSPAGVDRLYRRTDLVPVETVYMGRN